MMLKSYQESAASSCEIEKKIEKAKLQVDVGSKYYHYRERYKEYLILSLGVQEATEEICVVYQALYGDNIVWVRNLDLFLSEVDCDGKKVSRFQKVSSYHAEKQPRISTNEKDGDEIFHKLQQAAKCVEKQKKYTHYRDSTKFYQVLALGVQEATEEICVIYKALYGSGIVWVRSLSDFIAEVVIDGTSIPRFKKVDDIKYQVSSCN